MDRQNLIYLQISRGHPLIDRESPHRTRELEPQLPETADFRTGQKHADYLQPFLSVTETGVFSGIGESQCYCRNWVCHHTLTHMATCDQGLFLNKILNLAFIKILPWSRNSRVGQLPHINPSEYWLNLSSLPL